MIYEFAATLSRQRADALPFPHMRCFAKRKRVISNRSHPWSPLRRFDTARVSGRQHALFRRRHLCQFTRFAATTHRRPPFGNERRVAAHQRRIPPR